MSHLDHFIFPVEGILCRGGCRIGCGRAFTSRESAAPSRPDAFYGNADALQMTVRSAAPGLAAGTGSPGA